MNSFIRKSVLMISTLFLVLGLSTNAFAKIKIIVVTHGQDASAFWSVAKKGVTDAAAQYENIADVQYRNPKEFDMVEMAQIIDNACAASISLSTVTGFFVIISFTKWRVRFL